MQTPLDIGTAGAIPDPDNRPELKSRRTPWLQPSTHEPQKTLGRPPPPLNASNDSCRRRMPLGRRLTALSKARVTPFRCRWPPSSRHSEFSRLDR